MAHRRLAFTLFLLLPLAGCLEDRLSVELFTQIHADGTCTRRVEYVLERVDTDRGGARVAFAAEESPLRLAHRLPSGEEWRIDEQVGEGLHRIVLDATLDSPNGFDGDYFTARNPRTPPARNFISAYTSPEDGVFEFYEVFRDPVSPVATVRALARDVAKRDQDFSRYFRDAFGDRAGAPKADDLRRSYLELFAEPFARDVADLATRPLYGPRERRDLDTVLEEVEARQGDLREAVRDLAPAVPVEDLDLAIDTAMDVLGESLLERVEDAGLPLFPGHRTVHISFRATLVLPYAIRRANTCATGDTAVWEFEGEDLYGRGFEMMALASAP